MRCVGPSDCGYTTDPTIWRPLSRPQFTEAIGEAICHLGASEVRLSWIYGVFTQRYRTDPHIYREYGEELNFGGRATKLEQTARAYFIKWPDQNLEGDFCKAIQTVRQFSLRDKSLTALLSKSTTGIWISIDGPTIPRLRMGSITLCSRPITRCAVGTPDRGLLTYIPRRKLAIFNGCSWNSLFPWMRYIGR